jgi:hypothetical protein
MLALYHNDMSLCAQKVRVCLAEKGLEWESRHLVLRAGEHQQPWYLDVEPQDIVLGQTEPADGCSIIDAGMRPMPVVAMEPGW